MMGEIDALIELKLLLAKLESTREGAEEVAPHMSEPSNELHEKMKEQQERMAQLQVEGELGVSNRSNALSRVDAFDYPNQEMKRYNDERGISAVSAIEVTKPMRLTVDNMVAGGAVEKIDIFIPNDFDTSKWGILQRAAVAKLDPKSTWSKEALPTIINAIVYAEKNHLSFEEGDVYLVSGRLAKTAQARIKQAMQSGLVEGYTLETAVGEMQKLQWRAGNATGAVEVPKLTTTVIVQLKTWKQPCSPYIATLDEWFDGSNPNWRVRPRYMLELNALGHALNRVATPSGVDSDEAPTQS